MNHGLVSLNGFGAQFDNCFFVGSSGQILRQSVLLCEDSGYIQRKFCTYCEEHIVSIREHELLHMVILPVKLKMQTVNTGMIFSKQRIQELEDRNPGVVGVSKLSTPDSLEHSGLW